MRTVEYPSDLTREQWKLIKPLIPRSRVGRPRKVSVKKICDAIFYLHHTGCPWCYLPKSYPCFKTVYYYFSKWSRDGVWEKICHHLHALVREKLGRRKNPHLGIMDAQSVRAARGESRAYDGFKKVRGRKRNILVDALGIIVGCKVHAANLPESKTGKEVLDRLPKKIGQDLETILADQGYRGALADYAEFYHHKQVTITNKGLNGTNLIPKRWIVERTFAWLNNFRRMSRDYECKVRNSESMLYMSMLPILLHRLAA